MNTKIARALIEAGRNGELKKEGERIVIAHNMAVVNGFLELPLLEFGMCDDMGDGIEVSVNAKPGAVLLSDLYGIKQAWGADNVMVYTCDVSGGRIGIIFKKA